jgi:hypothetical protein
MSADIDSSEDKLYTSMQAEAAPAAAMKAGNAGGTSLS